MKYFWTIKLTPTQFEQQLHQTDRKASDNETRTVDKTVQQSLTYKYHHSTKTTKKTDSQQRAEKGGFETNLNFVTQIRFRSR